MIHKCVKCKAEYEKGSDEILNGCICGSKLFYFVKEKSKNSKNKKDDELSYDEVNYFYELEDDENNEIIVFDIEAINVKSSGKYELNIDSMMKDEGLVYRYDEGKYSIDIDANFKKIKKR